LSNTWNPTFEEFKARSKELIAMIEDNSTGDRAETIASVKEEIARLPLKTRIDASFLFIQSTMQGQDMELHEWAKSVFGRKDGTFNAQGLAEFAFDMYSVQQEDLNLIPDLFPEKCLK
jgi:hypothetical protein